MLLAANPFRGAQDKKLPEITTRNVDTALAGLSNEEKSQLLVCMGKKLKEVQKEENFEFFPVFPNKK